MLCEKTSHSMCRHMLPIIIVMDVVYMLDEEYGENLQGKMGTTNNSDIQHQEEER